MATSQGEHANMPAQTTKPVHEVIALVREWVEQEASAIPNFAGAYLWAGITAMQPDEPFVLWRDVDVVVVVSAGAPEEESEDFFRGLSIEVIWKNLDKHQSVEAILANPSAGPNMAATQILADPTGLLEPLQKQVAAHYAEPRWVLARTMAERADAEAALAEMRAASSAVQRLDSARALLMALSGLLAVAQLRRPTTRRTLALLGELLCERDRADLHERALQVMGSATMTPEDTHALLALMMTAYDRSVEVYQTHFPYGFALREHLRPYYLQGSLEMIDEGNHREAVFWITILDIVFFALANDAPTEEQPMHAAQAQAMYAAIGMADAAGWEDRVALAEALATEIFALALPADR